MGWRGWCWRGAWGIGFIEEGAWGEFGERDVTLVLGFVLCGELSLDFMGEKWRAGSM
jgi:hypothetical protein